eukprot:scaffold127147_cov27-Tisochrysis_lutea.AAC.1
MNFGADVFTFPRVQAQRAGVVRHCCRMQATDNTLPVPAESQRSRCHGQVHECVFLCKGLCRMHDCMTGCVHGIAWCMSMVVHAHSACARWCTARGVCRRKYVACITCCMVICAYITGMLGDAAHTHTDACTCLHWVEVVPTAGAPLVWPTALGPKPTSVYALSIPILPSYPQHW